MSYRTSSVSSVRSISSDTCNIRLPQPGTGPHIVMWCHYKDSDCTERLIRLERLNDCSDLLARDVQYCPNDGPFTDVIINRKSLDPLVKVSKPHARGHFFAHTENSSKREEPLHRERRELRFWFYKNISQEDRESLATEFFKIIIEPETFPRGFGVFVRKLILMLQHYHMIRRLELFVQAAPEPQPEPEEWQLYEYQPIENYITVLTPAVYDYQYLPEVAVSKKTGVVFRVRAGADAHIALSNVYGETERRTYEVVIGAANNTRSQIRYGGRGPVEVECETRGVLDPQELRGFWLSWDNSCLKVGRGSVIGERSFLQWHIPPRKLHSINLMSVSTGHASDGQWEFIEYLERVTPWSNSKASRRKKVRRAVVWYSKKTKMLESLEEAFPQSLDTQQLLKLSTVSLAEMLEAVVFLKDLLKQGSVLEVSKGVWLRSPVYGSHTQHEMRMLDRLTDVGPSSPTILVLSTRYCEKVAMESMMDNKISYVVHPQQGSTVVYTVGRIAEHSVISLKLSRVYDTENSREKYSQLLDQLSGLFPRLAHVLVLGCGGGVPDYSDFTRHVRRGDVVVSVARREGGIQYIHCGGVEEGDPPSYFTSTYSSPDDLLQSAAKQINEYTTRGYDRPIWEKYIEKGMEILTPMDSSFHRPAAKTDRLYALLDGELVLVKHPQPDRAGREGCPSVRLGPVASGGLVALHDSHRLDFSQCNGDVVGFDGGLNELIDCLTDSQYSSFILVLGVSDYKDGSKTRTWQPYASLSAAAYIKNLIISLKTFSRRRTSYNH